jgi:hypothetical protein
VASRPPEIDNEGPTRKEWPLHTDLRPAPAPVLSLSTIFSKSMYQERDETNCAPAMIGSQELWDSQLNSYCFATAKVGRKSWAVMVDGRNTRKLEEASL